MPEDEALLRDEGKEVWGDRVLLGGAHAMRTAFVDLQLRIFDRFVRVALRRGYAEFVI
ncbi:MAG: hypothetical protein H7X74_03820 [Methyloceanibacter sp.]|nr:hypothetical protein [Methyloceanibacter sp.]